jgi:hypothetical protein
MSRFNTHEGTVVAQDCVDGIFVDPQLPKRFAQTSNESRPDSHQRWWDRPYIEKYTWESMSSGARGPENATQEERAAWFEAWRRKWFESWPSGTRYDVRCLDGGAWDRPTCWGMFGSLDQAVACAKGTGPSWRSRRTANE